MKETRQMNKWKRGDRLTNGGAEIGEQMLMD
jgi:hypothetical protein